MTDTPLRRSTRLSSAPRSVAAPRTVGRSRKAPSAAISTATAIASQAGASSRKGPVPKVKVTQSHAYGSAARLETGPDIRVPTAAFTQAFEDQRADAVEHDGFSSDGIRSPTPAPRVEPSVGRVDHSADDVDFPGGRVDFPGYHHNIPPAYGQYAAHDKTGTDLSLSWEHEDFLGGRTLSYLPLDTDKSPQDAPANAALSSSSSESDISDQAVDEQPAEFSFQTLLEILARNWLPVLKILGTIFTLLVIGFLLIGSNTPYSTERVPGIKIPSTRSLPFRLSYGFEKLKSIFTGGPTSFERSAHEFEESLRRFTHALPPEVAVRKTKDGQLEIDDQFWQALVSRLEEEGVGSTRNSRNSAYRHFLKDNEALLKANSAEMIKGIVHKDMDNIFAKALEQREILSRDEFVQLLQQKYLELSEKVDAEIQKLHASTKAWVRTETKDAITKIPMDQIRLKSLAFANLVANAELTLKHVNYFSHFLGAIIDVDLTSPTYLRPKAPATWRGVLFDILWQPITTRRGPIHALQRWEEPTECWCAARSEEHGLLQLGVQVPGAVAPSKVVIEHVPKAASLDIGTAPKDIEFWGHFPNLKDFEEAEGLAKYSGLNCDAEPVDEYVCLGRFSYDIYAPNHVQTFSLPFDLSALSIGATRFLVRVNENWGSDHTCLYRVRLLGQGVGSAVYPREM